MVLVLSGGDAVVQEMGDGRLATSARGISEGSDLGHGVIVVRSRVLARQGGARPPLVLVLLPGSLSFAGRGKRMGWRKLAGSASRVEARGGRAGLSGRRV